MKCPMTFDAESGTKRYDDISMCVEDRCAWWYQDIDINSATRGRCAILQLTTVINCEVKVR